MRFYSLKNDSSVFKDVVVKMIMYKISKSVG